MPSFGGGQTNPATASYGGNPNAFIPTGQSTGDSQYLTILDDLFRAYQSGTTPGQQFAPLAGQTISNIANNPYASLALQGAQSGAGYGMEAAQNAYAFSPFLNSIPSTLTGLAGDELGDARNMRGLAGTVAGYMPKVAGLAETAAGYAPLATAYAPQVGAGIKPLQDAASKILETGYDPRSAIYDALQNKTQQQSAVSNAQSGVYGPYAAGVSNDAMTNLNIDWENQQLNRQNTALGAASGAYGQAGRLGSEAAGIYGLGSSILGQAGNLYGQAGNLGREAGGLYQGAAGVTNQAADIYGNLIPNEIGKALGIGGQEAGIASTSAALPYNAYQNQQANVSNALTPGLAQMNTQYSVPQGLLSDLQSYLKLGQSATGLGFQGGQMGFNQNQQQLGDLGALFNAGVGGGGLSNLLYGQGGGLSNALGLGQGGLLGSFGGGGGNFAGTGLSAGDYAAVGTDPALLAQAAGGGGGGGFFGWLMSLFA